MPENEGLGQMSRKYSAIEYVWTQEKIANFIDFVNRPYFYQDVAFGTRTLTLEGGGKITMSNVIRTVTRSTTYDYVVPSTLQRRII